MPRNNKTKDERLKLINLTAFRNRNGLSQAKLAKKLGTSAAFISQVETGTCKMPVDKIKKIFELSSDNQWHTDELVPAWERYEILKLYLYDKEGDELEKLLSRYHSAFPDNILEAIHFGQIGINSALADRIIASLPNDFKPQKEWLMTGEGSAFPELNNETDSEDPKPAPLQINSSDYKDLLKTILANQERIEKELQEIKTLLLLKNR